MKRFIDLRGQVFSDDDLPLAEQEPCFAFYCTSIDKFETFSGNQCWTGLADFTDDYTYQNGVLDATYERLLSLMPEWAKNS